MGRKRKAVDKEDKTANAFLETTSNQELRLHTDNVQQNSNGVMIGKSRKITNIIRRSERLNSSVLPIGSKLVEENANLDENEKEETHISQQVNTFTDLREENLERDPHVHQFRTPPEVNERSWEEKVDYLVGAVEELKFKVFGRQNEGSSPDFSYKSLYIDSQKKIEALIEENYELVRKLEYARGKIAAYEVMKDTVGVPKEVIFVSSLGNATEATATLSPQNCTHPSPPDAADDPNLNNNCKKKKGRH